MVKKNQQMVFYLEVLKSDSVFLYQVYRLNYQKCFYICETVVRDVLYKKEIETQKL